MQHAAELRCAKEQFVSNLQGTTKWEVFCVVSCLPLCLLTAAYAEAWVAARRRAAGKLLSRLLLALPKFCYEFGLVVVPQVLLLMSLAPAEPAFLLLFLLWGSLALKLWMKLAHSPGSRQHMAHMLQHISAPRKRFVSVFRGGLMLTTCLAILAVDFAAFPRRYAKAEGYGTGLMDVGVGAIVWAGGLVSAAAVAAAAAAPAAPAASAAAQDGTAMKHGAAGARLAAVAATWACQLGQGLRAALPLVVLGGARLVATSAVGYQHHVGEYGLCWNFFWSIAGVSLATLALPVPPGWLGPLGLAVSLGHQALLSLDLGLTGLTRPGSSAPGSSGLTAAAATSGSLAGQRSGLSGPSGPLLPVPGSLGAWLHAELPAEQRAQLGFWVANKEGLGSLPGYWALHLMGAAVGHQLAAGCAAAAAQGRACLAASGGAGGGSSRAAAAVGECARVVWSWVGRLLLADCAVWLALLAAETWLEPVSRRSCNLPYVLWVTAQCMAWLLLCLMGDLLTSGLAGATTSSPASPVISSRIMARSNASGTVESAAAAVSVATGPGGGAAGGQAGAAALRHRPASRRRSASSPTAALTAAGAAAAAVASGASEGAAGVARSAAAAAAAAASRSSYEAPGPPPGGASQQPAQASPCSSSSSDGAAAGASCGPPGTPERHRRQQQQQQQHQQQVPAAGAAGPGAGGSSSSSSGGPMRLMLSFNRNMLGLFLAANLLTGAVNLSMNTLAVGRWGARIIVGLYMLLLCRLAAWLDSLGITLKAW